MSFKSADLFASSWRNIRILLALFIQFYWNKLANKFSQSEWSHKSISMIFLYKIYLRFFSHSTFIIVMKPFSVVVVILYIEMKWDLELFVWIHWAGLGWSKIGLIFAITIDIQTKSNRIICGNCKYANEWKSIFLRFNIVTIAIRNDKM